MRAVLFFILAIVPFSKAFSETINVIECYGCTESQARDIGQQAAYSGRIGWTSSYYVFNRNNERLYAFNLPQYTRFSPSRQVDRAVRDTFGWYESRRAGLNIVVEQLSETFTTPEQHAQFTNYIDLNLNQEDGLECDQDASYRAITDAFDPRLRRDIERHLNEEYQSLNLLHYPTFQSINFTAQGIQALYAGMRVNVLFAYPRINPQLTYSYNWPSDSPAEQHSTHSRVMFTVGMDGDAVWATLNKRLSVIDGTSIEALQHPLVSAFQDNPVSVCAAIGLNVVSNAVVTPE